jgi:hypothetical protein
VQTWCSWGASCCGIRSGCFTRPRSSNTTSTGPCSTFSPPLARH